MKKNKDFFIGGDFIINKSHIMFANYHQFGPDTWGWTITMSNGKEYSPECFSKLSDIKRILE